MDVTDVRPRDSPFNDVVSVSLDAGQEAVIGYEPEDRRSNFIVPTVAISKYPNSTYTVELDSQTRFGPAEIPPTDIDDDVETFVPAEAFSDRMEIVVSNLSSSTRTYHIQVKGRERRGTVDQGSGRGW